MTSRFNSDASNVAAGKRAADTTTLSHWFDGPRSVELDEQVVGLGSYGYTLTVLSGEALADDPDEEEDEEARLIESYTPRFAYGR